MQRGKVKSKLHLKESTHLKGILKNMHTTYWHLKENLRLNHKFLVSMSGQYG